MQSKMRILSYHYIQNNGAFLFVFSLARLLQKEFSNFDVRILDYKSGRLAIYEYLKRFKFFQKIPLFYMNRTRLWNAEIKAHLNLDKGVPYFASDKKVQEYFAGQYDAIVIGMDVWCVINGTERPKFPNIYWLPEKTDIPKIAYGVSAYNSDLRLIQQSASQIGDYLNGFDVIGARDRFTYQLVQEHRSRTDGLVELIPDPTFTYEFRNTNVAEKLRSLGVDLNRKILGLLLFGDKALSSKILSHYKARGYQILAMSMYNPIADFNLGHLLTPFEWAEAFRYFSFCITDRFHGTIFCLKNHIPFVSLEKERGLPRSQSKLFDLLSGFGLETCYQNSTDEGFIPEKFLFHADDIEKSWENSFKADIQPRIDSLKREHSRFISKMKIEINNRMVKPGS
ncbi:MAG: polysaccharide pyruvyl transferase family protein [Chloroflexi bacterium]|nr:polysaccharide pyruvyl transferase family protein [Chloroflexota bacterium]